MQLLVVTSLYIQSERLIQIFVYMPRKATIRDTNEHGLPFVLRSAFFPRMGRMLYKVKINNIPADGWGRDDIRQCAHQSFHTQFVAGHIWYTVENTMEMQSLPEIVNLYKM